jgi:hypothetical protein
MKNTYLMALLCLITMCAFTQKKTEYTASNGVTYHVGDTVRLGRGSSPQGKFEYVQIGGWASAFVTDAGKGDEKYDLERGFAGMRAVIKKINSEKNTDLSAYSSWLD